MSSLFNLFGTIGADTSGFDSALDETAKSSEAAFARMAASARKYLGAGGLLWTMRRVMAESNQFNQTMADLSAITDRNTRAMSKSLLALDGALGKPIRSAHTLYETVSAGIRGSEQELTNFVESAGKAAKVIRAEMYTTSNAMTTLMHAYQIPINESNKLIDSFYTIVKEGKAHGHELARTLGLVANSASEAGLSLNEMFAAAASLSRTMTPSNAMISLNQMMNSFMGPTEKSKKAAKEFGIEMSSTALKTKGFAAVLRDVHEKVGGNVEAIKSLFGNIRAARGALALTGKQFNNFIDILEEFEFAAGRGEEALAKQLDTSQAAMERMHASIDKLKITVGTDLDAFAKAFYKTVDGVISGFNRSGKAATEFFESVGVAKDSPFLQFFSGIEEHTKSFSRFVFYALVAVKTFKNLKMILTEISFELKKIEAAQASRAMQQKMQKPAPALTDVVPDKTAAKTKTTAETVPTEELKTELNAIRTSLRQATRDLKEVSKVTDGIVDIVDGADGLKTQILNIRDALVQFNRTAKSLYKEVIKLNTSTSDATEQMRLVNAEKTVAAVSKLHTQIRGFITRMERLRESALEANKGLTAANTESKSAYKQILKVIGNLVTQAQTTAGSLATFSNVMTEINNAFATVITNAKIVAADVARLSASLQGTHLALGSGEATPVTKSATKSEAKSQTKKTVPRSKPTPSTTTKKAPVKTPPVIVGNRKIQQSDLEKYIITGFLSSGKSTKLADDFYSGLKTDLPEGYFTRPKGEFNIPKFREDVARRSTYRPQGDAYRSYVPYQSLTKPQWQYDRANPEYRKALSAARRKHIGGGEMSPLPFSSDMSVADRQMQEMMNLEAERWGKSMGLQVSAIDKTTENIEQAGKLAKKTGVLVTKSGKIIETKAKGLDIGGWGMAIFGGISAAQMGWNIGLSIAEKFKFDETQLFQTIGDALVGKFGKDSLEQLSDVSKHNVAMMSKGVLSQIERMGETAALSEMEKERFYRQVNKALTMGTPEESITRLQAIYDKLSEVEEERRTVTQKYNQTMKNLTQKQEDLTKRLEEVRSRLRGDPTKFTEKESAYIRSGISKEMSVPFYDRIRNSATFFSGKASLKDILRPYWTMRQKHRKLIEKYWFKDIDNELDKAIVEGRRLSREEIVDISTKDGIVLLKDSIIDSIFDLFTTVAEEHESSLKLEKELIKQRQVTAGQMIATQSLHTFNKLEEELFTNTIDNLINEVNAVAKYGIGTAGVAVSKSQIKDALLRPQAQKFFEAVNALRKIERQIEREQLPEETKKAALATAKEKMAKAVQDYNRAAEEAINFGIKAIEATIKEAQKILEDNLGKAAFLPSERMSATILKRRAESLSDVTQKIGKAMAEQDKEIARIERKIPYARLEKNAESKVDALKRELKIAQERRDEYKKQYWQAEIEELEAMGDLFRERQSKLDFQRRGVDYRYEMGQVGMESYLSQTLHYTDQIIAGLQKQIGELKEDTPLRRQLREELAREIKGRRDFIRDLEDNSRQLRDSVFGSVRDLVGDKFTSNSLYHAVNMLGMLSGPQTLQRLTSPTLSINQGYGMVDAQKAQKAVAASLDSYIMSQKYAQANIGKTVSKIYEVLKSGSSIIVR